MSPLGKPTDDGEIVLGSRHYGGTHGTLGPLAAWKCPACGKQNDGQKPEFGCVHCGAGDQRRGKAGTVPPAGESEVGRSAGAVAVAARRGQALLETSPPGGRAPQHAVPPHSSQPAVEPQRILRLIEYLIRPGENADEVLRRSLVGRMDFPWGTIVGTIVDSIDVSQEDRLKLARQQPGVWLGNQTAMDDVQSVRRGFLRRQEAEAVVYGLPGAPLGQAMAIIQREKQARMTTPDTGPPFSPEHALIARTIATNWGYPLAYTLALALQTIAPELEANMEPEKFLSAEECYALANALMQQIPAEWQQPTELAPPPGGPLPAGGNEAVERVRAGAKPVAVYKEPDERG